MKNTIIFDLDGTLALIDGRRDHALKMGKNGKMNWNVFFNPDNIDLDTPNQAVINMANILYSQDYIIYILSGRSDKTYQATIAWLDKHKVNYDLLIMRPQNQLYKKDFEYYMINGYSVIKDNLGRVKCSCKGFHFRKNCRHVKELGN